jgi:hypothetical protein
MRLRAGKPAPPAVGAEAPDGGMGMNILPGAPLPEWAQAQFAGTPISPSVPAEPPALPTVEALGTADAPAAEIPLLPTARDPEGGLGLAGAGAAATSDDSIASTHAAETVPAVAPAGAEKRADLLTQRHPELSAEQVAMLEWLAQRMVSGDLDPHSTPSAAPVLAAPVPVPVPGNDPAAWAQAEPMLLLEPPSDDPAPRARARGPRRGKRLVVLAGSGLVLLGAVGFAGPRLLDTFTESPEPVPATNLTMPGDVADLVAVASPGVSDQLQEMLGMGLRPAGVTVTAGFASKPDGPVTLAALASTAPTGSDRTEQISQWAQRLDAKVKGVVDGGAGAGGVSCAPVSKLPDAEPGSVCAFSGSNKRGLTYVVGKTPEEALKLTAEVRDSLTVAP